MNFRPPKEQANDFSYLWHDSLCDFMFPRARKDDLLRNAGEPLHE